MNGHPRNGRTTKLLPDSKSPSPLGLLIKANLKLEHCEISDRDVFCIFLVDEVKLQGFLFNEQDQSHLRAFRRSIIKKLQNRVITTY